MYAHKVRITAPATASRRVELTRLVEVLEHTQDGSVVYEYPVPGAGFIEGDYVVCGESEGTVTGILPGGRAFRVQWDE